MHCMSASFKDHNKQSLPLPQAAGAAAAAGASLDQVVAVARHVASSMATLGVALRVCTLPGKPTSDRLPGDQIEIGLGIHGEPGTTKAPMMAAGPLVQRMMDQMVRGARHSSHVMWRPADAC